MQGKCATCIDLHRNSNAGTSVHIASQERQSEEDKQQFDHLDVTDGFAISPAIGACSPSSGHYASSCVKPRMMLLDLPDGHSGRSTEVLVFRLI
jgi:hypothetical protein